MFWNPERHPGAVEPPQRPPVPASCVRPSQTPSGARVAGEPWPDPGTHHDRCRLRVPRRAEGLPAVRTGRRRRPRGRRGKQRPSDATLPLSPELQPSFGLSRAECMRTPHPSTTPRAREGGAERVTWEWGCINRLSRPSLPPPPGAVEPSLVPSDSWPMRGEPSRGYPGFGL